MEEKNKKILEKEMEKQEYLEAKLQILRNIYSLDLDGKKTIEIIKKFEINF